MGDNDLTNIPTEQLLAHLDTSGAGPAPAGVPSTGAGNAGAPAAVAPDLSGASTEDLLNALQGNSASPQPISNGGQAGSDAVTPQGTSVMGQLEHQGGLFVRGAVQAAAALPGAVSDAVTTPINAGLDLAMGKGNGFRFQHVGDALGNVMDEAGVAHPQTASERVVQGAMQGVGSAAGSVGLGMAIEQAATGPFTAAIGRMLQHAPLMQMASGAAGGGAQQVAQEAGAGPLTQAVAGIAGAVAPSLVPFGAAAGARALIRGGEEGAQQMQRNIDSFESATGTTPSLGQATQRPSIQAVETGLASSLGGTGIMQQAGQRQLDGMDDALAGLADQLSSRSTVTDAGDAISQGIDRFKSDFRDTQRQLYGRLDQLVEPDAPVRVDATKQVMADLNADIAGAPALSQWFRNAKIQGLQQALESDTSGAPASVQVYPQPPAAGGGLMNAPVPRDPLRVAIPEGPPSNTLPYEAVAKLRTLVGQELTNNSLTSDIPRSKWSALYAALSDDLGTAAADAGPQAQQAWQRANDFTRAGLQRLDTLDGIVSRDTPEAVYRAAMGANGEGGTRAQAIMKSLPVAERRQVAATTLKRMGLAAPGSQDERGDVFSSERFLTAYNRMSPQARTAIFSGTGLPGLQKKVDELARVAAIRRNSGSAFANPSGTARLGALMTQASALGAAIASGDLKNVALAAGGFAVPAALAKAATSPSIVKWAAAPTRMSPAFGPVAAAAALRAVSAGQQQPPMQHLADGGEVLHRGQPALARGLRGAEMHDATTSDRDGLSLRLADGGTVYRGYPAAAKARFEGGIDAHIVATDGGFVLVPKFANGGQVSAPAPSTQAAAIDALAHQAASSPRNGRPEPTAAQARVGNYKKGHVFLHGLSISIENPEGSTRRGVDPDGTPWESTIKGGHYGYLRNSRGADGDHVDMFVGAHPSSKVVHVIDQLNPDGSFNEHKALAAYPSAASARAAYLANYPLGQEKRIGAITSMPVAAFKAWATSGKLKEPLAWDPQAA